MGLGRLPRLLGPAQRHWLTEGPPGLCLAAVLCVCVQGYLYEMYKFEKNGSRTELARTATPPTDPVQTDVRVPGGVWYLNVCAVSTPVTVHLAD